MRGVLKSESKREAAKPLGFGKGRHHSHSQPEVKPTSTHVLFHVMTINATRFSPRAEIRSHVVGIRRVSDPEVQTRRVLPTCWAQITCRRNSPPPNSKRDAFCPRAENVSHAFGVPRNLGSEVRNRSPASDFNAFFSSSTTTTSLHRHLKLRRGCPS